MADQLQIIKGTDATWEVTMTDSDDVAIDISSAELTMTVKKEKEDSSAIFTRKNTAAGGGDDEIDFSTDGTDGKFKIFIVPANTPSSVEEGEYYFDCMAVIGTKTYKREPELFDIIEGVS